MLCLNGRAGIVLIVSRWLLLLVVGSMDRVAAASPAGRPGQRAAHEGGAWVALLARTGSAREPALLKLPTDTGRLDTGDPRNLALHPLHCRAAPWRLPRLPETRRRRRVGLPSSRPTARSRNSDCIEASASSRGPEAALEGRPGRVRWKRVAWCSGAVQVFAGMLGTVILCRERSRPIWRSFVDPRTFALGSPIVSSLLDL